MKRLAAGLVLAAAALACVRAPAAAPAVSDAAIRQPTAEGAALPPVLSAFGFFTDGVAQAPSPGVTPYRLNVPLWSDGAEKLRFLYLPAGTKAAGRGDGLLDLPVGAALVKTFAFGNGAQRRLIETRVLLHRAEGWIAASYKWDDDQREARLAAGGARVALTTPAGEAISYRIPNRNQCKECHALGAALSPIGPKGRNLDAGWLAAQAKAGRLDAAPKVVHPMPLWENRAKLAPAVAARAYLEANCAFCHQEGGAASNSGLWLGWDEADPVRLGIGKRPVAAGNASGGFLFDVAAGDPDHSIMVHRMASTEPGVAMPEIGRSSVDREGLAVIRGWISTLR